MSYYGRLFKNNKYKPIYFIFFEKGFRLVFAFKHQLNENLEYNSILKKEENNYLLLKRDGEDLWEIEMIKSPQNFTEIDIHTLLTHPISFVRDWAKERV